MRTTDRRNRVAPASLVLAITLLQMAGARQVAIAQTSDEELAKKLANPIAALISVPFEFNYNRGFGTEDGEQLLLNVQPVVPITLNDDWKVDQWSVPINASISKLTTIGSQKVQFQLGGRYWAESPSGGPENFGVSLKVTFLFPK